MCGVCASASKEDLSIFCMFYMSHQRYSFQDYICMTPVSFALYVYRFSLQIYAQPEKYCIQLSMPQMPCCKKRKHYTQRL